MSFLRVPCHIYTSRRAVFARLYSAASASPRIPETPLGQSVLGDAAIDHQLDAGDVRAVVGGEEYRRPGDIIGRADAVQGNLRDKIGLRLLVQQDVQTERRNVTGAQDVDADAAALEV